MQVRLATAILTSCLAVSVAAQGDAKAPKGTKEVAAKVDFEKQIWPILEKRCIECHSAEKVMPDGKKKKPKGGVVFDSKDGITSSKKGKLVIAKKPEDSLIVASISLPADDEDRMPPAKKGEPLSKEQIDLIKEWIGQGAEFGKWTGKAKEAGADKEKGTGDKPAGNDKPGEKAKDDPLVRLQAGLRPVPAATLAALASGEFAVASIGDASPLLQVTCAGHTDAVDDKTLAALLPIAEHITHLDLGRSRVGDEGCAVLAKMPRLTSLDLRQTQVGNHGVAALAACKELRSLNLFGTKVGDYGVTALASLEHLQDLYVWQTDVSAAAAVRLRESVPTARIVLAADLPEPLAEAAAGARRRAGK